MTKTQTDLQRSDVDVIDGSSRELSVKLFSTKSLQVVNEKLPEFEDVIPRELRPPLHDDCPGTQKLSLQGRPETNRPRPHHQHSVPLAVEAVATVELFSSLLLQYSEYFFILVRQHILQ